MSAHNYLPTRHEFLVIASFNRRIYAHRQQYVHVDYDLPFEIYLAIHENHAMVDRILLTVAEKAEFAADFTFLKENMGSVVLKTTSQEVVRFNRGWINANKWDPAVPRRMAEALGYCPMHDALFEITLSANMEWLEEMGRQWSKIVVLAHKPKPGVLRVRLN